MTVQTLPDVTMLPELVHARVEITPHATAVVCGDRRLSYAELWRHAGIMAERLRRAGAGAGHRVAVCLDRDVELPVTLLGILRAGAAYLPLDPEHPAERLAGTVEDSGASLIVARGVPSWLPAGVRTLSPGLDSGPDSGLAADVPITAAHPAYTIYTSGSTGRPKGVVISHRALANFMRSMQASLPLDEGSTMAAVTTVSFDIAALELFLPLLCGARVVIARAAEATDPVALAELLKRHGATVMQATPATWQMLRSVEWRAPEGFLLLCGGERLPADLGAWLTSFSGSQAWDLYGPTETTIWSTAARLGPDGRVAHWAPLLNTDIRILDAELAPVAGGAAGELCIGGDGLADGYVNRPALTADKFRPDPYAGRAGGRLYRTGDLARRRPDGSVEIIDRIDNQVKIRGYRVELGEIESVLAAHAGVRQAVVHPVTGAAGGKILAAYVVPEGTAPDPAELNAWLGAKLPPYMLPARYTTVTTFPLTGNGKIDRKALADLPIAPAARPYAAPRDAVEQAVAAVWSEVLGHTDAGLDDDFLALGGTSLAAARMLGGLRQRLRAEIPMALLLEHVTLREQAAAIARALAAPGHAPAGDAAIPRADRSRPLPLSPAQQRLWFAAQLRDMQSIDRTELRCRVRGPLDVPALRRAVEQVVDRHEILRTAFPTGPDGRPYQHILDDPADGFTFRAGRDADLDGALREPFDPARGPLMRVDIAVCGPDEHLLQFQWHHLVFDGVSTDLFRAELAAGYAAACAGRPDQPAPLPLQYADAAAWQCHAALGDPGTEEYWRRRLDGLPALSTLPADRPRPATPTGAGARLWRDLPAELVSGLAGTAARHRLTPYMALLAGFGVVLSRYCGSRDVVVGSPVTDREHADLEPLIGFFLNTLVLRLDADGTVRVEDYLAQVRRSAIDAFGHAAMPFDRLVEALAPERSGAHHPLFQVLFNLDAADLEGPSLPGLQLVEEPVDPGTARFDLAVTVRTAGGVPARVEFEYATDLFDRGTLDRFADHYLALLTALVAAAPDDTVDALPMLTAEDEAELRPHHAPLPHRPAERRVHDLVRAWTSRTPDAIAVAAAGIDLTYAELDRRANRLAHRLRRHGMPTGAVVGAHLTPDVDLVVAMLAILKAGGAYLPLDPAQPAERRQRMIEDAGCRFVVGAPPATGAGPGPVVLEVAPDSSDDAPDTEPVTGVRPDDLAYLLYTSGSTGAPKGVAMPHLALVDLIDWHTRQQLAGVRTAQLAAVSFDVSFQEIFIPLASGGTVVMAPAAIRGEPDRIAAWLAATGVAQLITTPTMLEQLCRSWREEPSGTPPALTEVTVAGEQFVPTATMIATLSSAGVTVHNQYGPAETHCVTAHPCPSLREATSPPIGRAVPGKRIYLLDRLLRPVPAGLPGEIFVGGAGIARGYAGLPGPTAERFLPDPFAEWPGSRMYRTGDVARRDRDGLLHFLGRADRQIKIRGVRIEPAEVEAALLTHSRVRAAAVIASEARSGDLRLAAYLVLDGDGGGVPADLDGWLARSLPRYMIPSGYLTVAALPTTVSGKLDRAALPSFPWHARPAEPVAPRTDAERRIADVWAAALGLPAVGLHDNFFAIGGHSLLAAHVAARLRERLGAAVSVRDIFDAPTVAELTQRTTTSPAASDSAQAGPVPTPRDRALPLSYAQQRLWFLDQLHPGATDYHLGWALRLRGPLDVAALRRAVSRIIERHEILRTRYPVAGGRPGQEVLPPAPVELPVRPAAAGGLEEAIRQECARSFDLAAGRVFRASLLRTGPDEHILLGVAHHIAADGWSLAVFDRELAVGYAQATAGRPAPGTPLPVQYADYAAWEQQQRTSRSLASDLDYWRETLAGVRPLSLGDRPASGPPGAAGIETFVLGPDSTAALDELATDRHATLFMILASAFAVVLGKRAGTDDVTIGVPVAGRDVPGVADLIGCFVNTVVLRTRLRADEAYADLLTRTRRSAIEMYQRQHVPFDLVVQHVAPRRQAAHNPLFNAMISMTEESHLSLPGLVVSPVPVPGTDASFAIDLRVERRADGSLHGELEYDTARFSTAAAARVTAQYARVLRTVGQDPRRPAGQL